jgi:DNA primase
MKEQSGSDGAVQGKPKSHRSSAPSVSPSATRRIVKARAVTPQEIKDRLNPSVMLAICRDWIPDGKQQGNWWICRTPWRADRNPSFAVSLTTGHWEDFAAGEKGDIIALAMRLFGDSFTQVIEDFADMLGINRA